ncbi:DUF2061 domain-containing protein [Pelagovum pacificum]|uniref:DUF2061 domain-containing protein n=1 Tax=Pelagovum pacificum TaxID=2588711 RepID=A0A5C5GFA7_9RHOB|nr:DUF2061 domain-containing protein [Pelagovum pacificum]QQA43645.1 DUF2061 domain-containing protein [Pelagovum pacificum]TNY33220.1 DUF2061 domain-containing protein [Pelagovum pacificum]
METKTRSVVKAVLWNLLGLAVMALVGLIMTGSIAVGGAMALINAALGLSMYFIYERVWDGIEWGRDA